MRTEFRLEIKTEEVLRYLGYKDNKPDEGVLENIKKCRAVLQKSLSLRYVYSFFDTSISDGGIAVTGTKLRFPSLDVTMLLQDCKKIVLMAVSLGQEFERVLRETEVKSLADALVLDACGSAAIEELCDMVEEKIRGMFRLMGDDITDRLSPGYGDFPITVQRDFLNILDTQRRIGLTCTDTYILTPRKSVTAVMGILQSGEYVRKRTCDGCDKYDKCAYRKEGISCVLQ